MARLDPKHFTRCRTLTPPTVPVFLLSSVHAAVQSELDQFFANLRNRADSVREATAQAFYQARYKINALVFGEVNQHRMWDWWRNTSRSRAERGLRVVAAGWQRFASTMMKDNVRSIVTGMAFGLYLPGIEPASNFRLH
ncbi:MAG: hypothetical protein IPJ27_12050 [Candidatus Accumulibacter sp.]|uniref:Uncharacterized protein n=1 Tax=Candidatus Accumulibacter proximus TaxID=2954385 RepID=A0A935PXZ2_9PROT|nr:hypothetical protein [Candidatus Accumulibacter proximus]